MPDAEQLWGLFENYGIPAIKVLLIILAALLIGAWLARIIKGICDRSKLDDTLSKFFARATRWALMLIAALFCLGEFGVEVTSFAVILGAAGLAIGLAFQGTLSNLAAGVMLLIFRPFKAGDVVNVAGETGKIDEIELFTTAMNTPDNRRIIVPNGTIFGAVIENITFHDTRRVDVSVGVEYGADIDQTRQTLEQAVTMVPDRLEDPAAQVYLKELGSSSVDWVVRVWCRTEDYWAVREAATRQVKLSLDDAGIGIPFPQMDVHLDEPVAK